MGTEIIFASLIATLLLVGGGMLASKFLSASPKAKNAQKEEAYECGIPTTGPAHIQFKVGYYLFAILFLLFDVEVVFLVPWAVVMKKIGTVAFVEVLVFLVILGLGLAYAWKKKALEWE